MSRKKTAAPLSTVASRIRHARDLRGLEPHQLRDALIGIDRKWALSRQQLHRYENEDLDYPSPEVIRWIARATGVLPGWILFGDGPMLAESEADADELRELSEEIAGLTPEQRRHLLAFVRSLRRASRGA
jgi:transcriptional regulator with XRE-family HTH domain